MTSSYSREATFMVCSIFSQVYKSIMIKTYHSLTMLRRIMNMNLFNIEQKY